MNSDAVAYFKIVEQCAKTLKTIETYLDKAEKYAAAKNFEPAVLLEGRLTADMKPLTYQIQSACDYVKGAAAWLSGQAPPKHEDNEKTIGELRARIGKTVAFVESIDASRYANAGDQKVKLSWAPGKVLGGEDYLLQMTIPNVYFHIAMVYAILRQNGIDVGKMDFLGSINFQNV